MTEDKTTCPHIISSDEGTSYCDLAGKTAEYISLLEKHNAYLAEALQQARNELQRLSRKP